MDYIGAPSISRLVLSSYTTLSDFAIEIANAGDDHQMDDDRTQIKRASGCRKSEVSF